MRQVRILAALGLLAAAAGANAEVSSTWTLTNDYDFRGITQSAKDPAVQASLDCATESGWYVGAWASNVDFGDDVDIDYEVDLYTGFSGGEEEGLGWDVGLVYYAYPDESDANYPEIYGKLNYDVFSGALFYSNDYVNSSEKRDVHLGRRERAAAVEFLDHWRTPATASATSGTERTVSRARTTSTTSVGVGYTVGHFDLALKYVDTTLDEGDFGFSDDDVFNYGRPRGLHDRDDVPLGQRVTMSG